MRAGAAAKAGTSAPGGAWVGVLPRWKEGEGSFDPPDDVAGGRRPQAGP